MTGLRDDLDRALRSVTTGEAPVQRAMRDGRRLRNRRRIAVLAGALAIAAVAAGAPSLGRGTAAAPPAPLTGPTATPAATATLANGDPVVTAGPAAGATQAADGLASRNGVIAQGTVSAARWQLTVRGPGRANPEPADSCATVTFSTAAPPANLGDGCLDLQAVLATMVSGGDPAALTGEGDGTTEATVGEAAGDVTYFIVTFTDGQQLKLIPVTSGGHRYVGWVAPQRMVVASLTAHLGGPYTDSGETATAVPYDPPGATPSFGLWLRTGQAAPPRAHAVIGHGTADGTAWSTSAYEGPWGTCVVVSPNATSCWRTRLAATMVLGGGASGSTPGPAYGSAAPGVARLRLTLSNGTSVQVTPVTVGNERLFAFWTGAGVSLTGWTAYDAAGRVTASMALLEPALTSRQPPVRAGARPVSLVPDSDSDSDSDHERGQGLLMSRLSYGSARLAVTQVNLAAVAKYVFWLMFRNVASDGLVFDDPVNTGIISAPGCVLASPSWENTATHVTQDYVYHWTRDAAIVALELAWAYANGTLPDNQPLIDYVTFSRTCQQSAGDFDRASFYINGTQRPWTNQTDGPALQTLALLAMYGQLDPPAQATALTLIDANLSFLSGAYQGETFNLWEEEYGYSFFARSAQLRCFQAIAANGIGVTVPSWLPDAITWLISALDGHWNGEVYQSVLPGPADYRAPYDPNIDIVQAAIYGAESVTDPRLLATAAQLRAQWADPGSKYYYPINGADAAAGLGPLLGRYPGDVYDGDTDAQSGDHPWALTTANFAELYYRVAARISASKTVPADPLSASFLAQAGVTPSAVPADAVTALRAAGDAMLQAIVYHSDHLELSEQFDANTGFEKSVANLSWSYAAFLSAVRARGA